MGNRVYSVEFKKSAVEKLLNRGNHSVKSIIDELGVPSPTLYQWKHDLGKSGGMKNKSTRPQDRSPEDKLKAVVEYEAASLEARGEVLRRLGLHKEHIEAWQGQVMAALKHGAIGKHVERSERAEDHRKIKDLEKDLNRKNKALAETTALLVLKKKADLIWGTVDEE